MAITWGGASGHMRVGIDVSQSGAVSSGSVRLTVVYYVQSVAYGHRWTYPLHRSGDISGDVSVSFYSASGATVTKEVARQTITVATKYGATVSKTFRASLGPIWNGGAPSVSRTHTIAARAYERPYAPTSVSAVTTNGRTIRVTWSQRRDASHPVSASGIERYDNQSKTWVRVGTVHGTGTSWSDSSLAAGRATYYRVWADNGLASAKAQSNVVYTTPTPAKNLKAVKDTVGNIIVTWTKTVLHNEGSYDIYDNGAFIGSVGNNITTFTHRNPSGANTHTYTVVTKTPNGLRSAVSSSSPAVQVLTAPGRPAWVGPTETVAPGTVTIAWAHNPRDTTAQTAAQVVVWPTYIYDAGVRIGENEQPTADAIRVDVAGDAQSVDVDLGIGWWSVRIRTRGQYLADTDDEAAWGPWGPSPLFVQRVRVAYPPEVQITTPGEVVTALRTSVSWSWYQAEAAVQASAVVQLIPMSGGVVGDMAETVEVSGAGTSVDLSTRLPDGSEWQILLTTRSSWGQITQTTATFAVAYPRPPSPLLEAVWDETTGAVSLSLSNPAPLAVSETVTNLVTDPRLVTAAAWTATSGTLATADAGASAGWAALTPTSPEAETRLSLAAPLAVTAGQYVLWAADLAVGEIPVAEAALPVTTVDLPDVGGVVRLSGVVSGDGMLLDVVDEAAASAPSAAESDVTVMVEWLDPDGTVLSTDGLSVAAGTDGVRAVWRGVVPDGATRARPVIAGTGGRIYVRRPLLTITSSEPTVSDWWDPAGPHAQLQGQSYAVSWDGEADASTSTAVPNSPPTDHNLLARSVDGGATWEPLDSVIPLGYATSDPLALSCGQTVYRAESVSADGASATTEVTVTAESQAMWISGGPDYRITAPLYGDPRHSLSVDLAERDTVFFAGRRLPVEMTGIHETRALSVSARLTDDDQDILDTLAALAVLPGPTLYRDPVGRRMWGSMSGLSLPRDYQGGVWDVDLSLTEVDPDD